MIKDYDKYEFTRLEFVQYLLKGILIALAIGILFYRNILGVVLCIPIIIFYLRQKKEEAIKKRKIKLNMEFKEAVISLQGALNSGYSIERAFTEILKDLSLIYKAESLIIKEVSYINNMIRMNQTVESALSDFAKRSKIEDIMNFADIFVISKRTGGNIIEIIQSTITNINEKIEVDRDIRTLFASKVYESKIMELMPFIMIVYLSVFSPEFLKPLYHNAQGVIIMTILLFVYFATFIWINKILEIEI
ncbi:MAG TPA: pilus assembly protein TadB [Clostridiales bacterium]|nr:pilus assembly protein TadB [Clostridiales bacterium]